MVNKINDMNVTEHILFPLEFKENQTPKVVISH